MHARAYERAVAPCSSGRSWRGPRAAPSPCRACRAPPRGAAGSLRPARRGRAPPDVRRVRNGAAAVCALAYPVDNGVVGLGSQQRRHDRLMIVLDRALQRRPTVLRGRAPPRRQPGPASLAAPRPGRRPGLGSPSVARAGEARACQSRRREAARAPSLCLCPRAHARDPHRLHMQHQRRRARWRTSLATLGSAFASISACTISVRPSSTARCSAVHPDSRA